MFAAWLLSTLCFIGRGTMVKEECTSWADICVCAGA